MNRKAPGMPEEAPAGFQRSLLYAGGCVVTVPMSASSIQIESLTHRYRDRLALDSVSFDVRPGEVFALLGPNGGGKTTLFRILCTSMTPASGRARVCECDVVAESQKVRRLIGVVFQHASLDAKLTVRENLTHQGHLYGLSGAVLSSRIDEMLQRFAVADRAQDRVDTLSGGLARRVDLAKGLLHRPRVLLLDEPSTGLDPQARWNVWQYLDRCRREDDLTVLMTTHFMDEADRCDRVGIIDSGKLVAVGTPEALKSEISGDVLHIESAAAADLVEGLSRRFDLRAVLVDNKVRLERPRAHEFIPQLVEAFPDSIRSVSLTKPSLEEVFIRKTGHRFETAGMEK
jgi:ABC-2 type transport system ATP-binding protein